MPPLQDNDFLKEIKDSIIKFDKRQKETALNIEELHDLLEQEQTNEADLIETFISVLDYFDDFYFFAAKDPSSLLFQQAEMMLNGIIKKMSAIGITRIRDEKTEFDSNFNTIDSTEQDDALPDGYITRTLKCGYVYNGTVIRKSKVIIIKN